MTIQSVPLLQFLRELGRKSSEDKVANGAAALGFYLTLAIFPAMILTMSLIPYLPVERVDQAIMDLLRQALPQQAAEMFTGVVSEVTGEQRGGLLSIGALATLWATSTGMYAIMQQLNVTYDVKEARSFLRARAVAIALSLLFSALMLVAFSLIVLGGVVQEWIGERFGFSQALLAFFAVLRWVIIVFSLQLAFALTYHLAPNIEHGRFRLVNRGAVTATVLLMIASVGFAIYVQNFANYGAVYGGIGAVIALMLWLYIAGLAMLVGSEVNVLTQRRRGAPLPQPAAEGKASRRGRAAAG
jgi:membrane protein